MNEKWKNLPASCMLKVVFWLFTAAFLVAAIVSPDRAELLSGLQAIYTTPAQVTKDYVRPGQVVIDVSMNWDAEKVTTRGKGGMSGDAIFDEVEPIVDAITPVPGGVGAVTTSVLMKHVVEAAEKI